ncbi:MAG: HEAT repeat domain-containing protein [Promethearchaeota archaeon]|jgi:HEAT repeat protein
MNWHEQNVKYNALIKTLFHDEDWQQRAEAARELGIMEEGRAVNLLCRALRSENDHIVINKIIEALGKIGDGRSTLRIIEKLIEELDKPEKDKFRIIYILEALKGIKDKRALEYIGLFLESSDDTLKSLAKDVFDEIEPDWRNIIKKERKEKTIQEIFRIKI